MRYQIYDSDINTFLAKHKSLIDAPNVQDVKGAVTKGSGAIKKMAGSFIGLIMVILFITLALFSFVLTIVGLLTLDKLGKVKIVLLFIMLVLFSFMTGKHMITML